jgi:putative transposase
MVSEHRLSRSKAFQIVGFSRSALYKPRVDWAAKDAPVIAALNEMVSKRSLWGFWTCFHRLRADGHEWNHKKVHRVYCAMKLNLQRKAKKRLITRERQPLGTAMELNNIWALGACDGSIDRGLWQTTSNTDRQRPRNDISGLHGLG